jgi:hypothetical protein
MLPAIQQRAEYQTVAQEQRKAGEIKLGPEESLYREPPLGGAPTAVITGTPKPGTMDDWVTRWRRMATDAKGQPLTDAETQAVDTKAIDAYKKTTTDPAAAAALERQALAERFMVTQQARTQAFTEAEAGRGELTNKVEQPYLDAREKTQTLRNIVQAAQGGNMEAAAVQSLMGTLGLITAEGVKRINTTELQQVAGAGDLLTRIQGQVSRGLTGNPLPQKLQTDLIGLANLLDKGSYDKYASGFGRITKRYGLKDEQPLPAPPPPVTPPATSGLSDLAKRRGVQ